jgi:hypothetical protein
MDCHLIAHQQRLNFAIQPSDLSLTDFDLKLGPQLPPYLLELLLVIIPPLSNVGQHIQAIRDMG